MKTPSKNAFSRPLKKTLLAGILASTLTMTGCIETVDDVDAYIVPAATQEITFAAFNVSFAVDGDRGDNFQRWVDYMSLTRAQQDELITLWNNNTGGIPEDHALAERVIQIRNIAAIIQKNRPDVLALNEFNNDGTGVSTAALEAFQANYLAHPQSLNSVDGGDLLEPISYPFAVSYPTNTGKKPTAADSDLNNDGVDVSSAGDAYGFGFYHGQYAFALMSKFEVDTANTRTFQNFKWKDLPGETNPVIVCDSLGAPVTGKPLPANMVCGDTWYTDKEWQDMPLSSKNHVDAPIIIPTANGNRIVHALLAHPTPSIDGAAAYNTARNGAENKFWAHYLNGLSVTDDKNVNTKFAGKDFVLMGDFNADFERSPGNKNGFGELMTSPKVNHGVSLVGGDFVPTSSGATHEPNVPPSYDQAQGPHPYPETRTSTFGSRVDYALPSADLSVVDTGVYWAAEGELGRLLFNDPRLGKYGNGKEVSSDHRFVWVKFAIEK